MTSATTSMIATKVVFRTLRGVGWWCAPPVRHYAVGVGRKKRQRRAEFMRLINKFRMPPFMTRKRDVWLEFDKEAEIYDPVDLAQYVPDFIPGEHLLHALKKISESPNHTIHQATRAGGHPRLVKALSALYSTLVQHNVHPMSEICVTLGEYQSLLVCILAHVMPRDEVVIIEPESELVERLVRYARGKTRAVALRPREGAIGCSSEDWVLDEDVLEKTVNARTKMILLTSPNANVGKVYSMDELEFIAYLCNKWNVMCVTNECYEFCVYEPHKFVRMCTLPGMWNRTLSVGEIGKMFGLTGWRIGWVYGPPTLMEHVRAMQRALTRSVCTVLQEAVAMILEREKERFGTSLSYLSTVSQRLEVHRLFMADTLTEFGMFPVFPQGSTYMMTDWTSFEKEMGDFKLFDDRPIDYHFAKWMMMKKRILGLPASAFVSSEEDKELYKRYVRFCFGKKMKTLERFSDKLDEWRKSRCIMTESS